VIALLWVYTIPHSSLVVLVDAAFTRVYAKRRGLPLEPKEDVVRANNRWRA
jgi:hypothetical protein